MDAFDNATLWPEVRAFDGVLSAACVLDELEVGMGCMRVIEHTFWSISAAIGSGAVKRGWVERSQAIHYALHAESDERHADEFYSAVEPEWSNPTRRDHIVQGPELGTYTFEQLYPDLYAKALEISESGRLSFAEILHRPFQE